MGSLGAAAAGAGAATGCTALAGGCGTPAGGSSGGGSVNTGAGIVGGGAAGAGTARGLDQRDRASSHFEAVRLSAKAWISWKFFLPLHHLKYAPDALCFQNVLSQVLHTSLLFDGILTQPSPVPLGLPHMTHQFAVLALVLRLKLMTESYAGIGWAGKLSSGGRAST